MLPQLPKVQGYSSDLIFLYRNYGNGNEGTDEANLGPETQCLQTVFVSILD
ncbi:unnamed protein product [Alternaria alternata]